MKFVLHLVHCDSDLQRIAELMSALVNYVDY